VRVRGHQRALARSCAWNLPTKCSPARRPAPGAAPEGDYDAEEGLTFETSKGIRVVQTFDDMRLKDLLMRGIYQFGFEKPSAIQQRAIMPIAEGRDVIAQAQSGTGKTSMIAVAMCQRVDTSMRECAPRLRARAAPCLLSARLRASAAAWPAMGARATRGGARSWRHTLLSQRLGCI